MKRPQIFFIVDDDPDDLDLFIEALEKIDPCIAYETATDSQAALKRLGEMEIMPDIIFLDLNMPRLNGRQCLAEIKKVERLAQIPVVIYSTSSYEKDIQETRELGAASFFTKPSSFNELCQILTDISNGEFIYTAAGKF